MNNQNIDVMRLKLRYLLLVLGLMLSSVMLAQSIKWRDIYTVKKKDTGSGASEAKKMRALIMILL